MAPAASRRTIASAPAPAGAGAFSASCCSALGLIIADQAGSLLALIPLAAVGALLLFSAADLALSKRLFDARPSCWPVIGITAAVTAWADPFWGLLAGCLAELARGRILALRESARRSG